MQHLFNLLKPRWWRFEWRYWRRQTPWNTGITPPEVVAFISQTPAGRALDIGCGTGTSSLTLARQGWEVTGVDFSLRAIRLARQKAAAQNLQIDFHVHDAADIGFLRPTFDYVLDIGCLFTMTPASRYRYARGLVRLTAPASRYMLYAWLPRLRQGSSVGMGQEEVEGLLHPFFRLDHMEIGTDGGGKSAWYWFTRRHVRIP